MKRRSSAGGKPAKPRVLKRSTPKRSNVPKATRDRRTSIAADEPQVTRLEHDLNEAWEQQTATSEILKIISSSPTSVQVVLDTVVANAAQLCRAFNATIYLRDGDIAVIQAQFGYGGSAVGTRRSLDADWVIGRAVLEARTIHVPDMVTSEEYPKGKEISLSLGYRTVLAVPLLRDRAAIGAILAMRREVCPFTDRQIALLQNFAAQAVIAIENTRLLNELKQSLEQQTATADVLRVISSSVGQLDPIFQAILPNAIRLCEANFGNLFLRDGNGFRTVAIHSPPSAYTDWYERHPFVEPTKEYPHSTLARLDETKETLHIADLRLDRGYLEGYPPIVALVDGAGARTDLLVPMLREDQLIGAIVIYRTEVRPFSQKQIELVQNFAAQAVIAIENSRLLNELRESLERQTATADILRVIASTPEDSKRALDTIAETASHMFGVANVNFRRIDGNVLRIVSSAGPTIERLRKALPDIPLEATDPAVRCFLDNRQIPIEDRQAVLTNERGAIAAALRELPVRSQVFTPLSRRGKAIGVMIVTRGEVQPFQQSDLDLMKGFADQAVIAIENARLLNELRERTEEVLKLNQQLEQRVADQVGEIERMSRLRRFLPPQVADLIVASGTEKQLESHRREITALFCDLRGFTGFSESADPEDVMTLLRGYHAAIGEIVIRYGGTLERFAGDGVMVVFNDPVPVENPALQAVLMALEMRMAIGALVEKWRDLGHDLGFGIGIAHGFATLGTIGFEGRFDYAAIGTVSNVASRLCDEAKPGQILISPRVRQAVDKAVTVEPVGEFTLKGIRRSMMTYNVLEPLPSKPN